MTRHDAPHGELVEQLEGALMNSMGYDFEIRADFVREIIAALSAPSETVASTEQRESAASSACSVDEKEAVAGYPSPAASGQSDSHPTPRTDAIALKDALKLAKGWWLDPWKSDTTPNSEMARFLGKAYVSLYNLYKCWLKERDGLLMEVSVLHRKLAEAQKDAESLHSVLCIACGHMNLGDMHPAHNVIKQALVDYADDALAAGRKERESIVRECLALLEKPIYPARLCPSSLNETVEVQHAAILKHFGLEKK